MKKFIIIFLIYCVVSKSILAVDNTLIKTFFRDKNKLVNMALILFQFCHVFSIMETQATSAAKTSGHENFPALVLGS